MSVTDDAYQDGVAPAAGEVAFTVDSTNANTVVVPVVLADADDNNQLNLNADDEPAEDFGIGGAKHWVPEEADLGTTTDRVAIALQARNQYTTPNDLFNYTLGTDTFRYQSPGVSDFTMGDAEWENLLSGDLRRDGKDVVNDETTGNNVLGDQVQADYNPNGPSTFTILDDVPAAVSNVTATRNDNDTDGDDNDVTVEWDEPSNPDVDNYEVWRSQQPAGANETDYRLQGTVAGGTTQFNQIDLAGDAVYRYRVVPFNQNGNEGPESGIGQAEVPADVLTDTPVSEASQVDNTDNDGRPTATLDAGDTVTFTFRGEPLTLGASPSVDLIDSDGTRATVSGANASFRIGGPDEEQLLIEMSAKPEITGTAGGDEINLNTFTEVSATSGIGNANGAWNLAESGLESDDPDTANEEIRVFGGGGAPNGALPEEVADAGLSADSAADEVTIAAGTGPIEDGDAFTVFDGQGTPIGSGTYNNAAGNTVTVDAFEPGDTLYLVYADDNTPDLLSQTAVVPNPPETPEVASVDATAGAADQIAVSWTDDDLPDPQGITQVSDPANYEVYDSANNTLVATGEATTPPRGDSTGGNCSPCEIQVDLNTDLAPGSTYTLRVADQTVQDPNNNPNEAQTQGFGS